MSPAKIDLSSRKEEIIHDYKSGMYIKNIAEKFGVHGRIISRVLAQENIEIKTGPSKGCRLNIVHKLDDHENDVVNAYISGQTLQTIADKYEVTTWTINDCLKRHGVVRRKTGDKYAKNPTFFDNIDTDSKAYIFGIMLADGYVNGKNKASISLTDYELVEKIREKIGYLSPIFTDQKRNLKNSKPAHILQINGEHINKRLVSMGCGPRKSLSMGSEPLRHVPDNLLHAFVRGYFDGDGSISATANKKRKHLVSMVGTYEFLSAISERMPVTARVYKTPRQGIDTLLIKSSDVFNFRDWIYAGSTIHLDRKYNRFYSEVSEWTDYRGRVR